MASDTDFTQNPGITENIKNIMGRTGSSSVVWVESKKISHLKIKKGEKLHHFSGDDKICN